MSFSLNVKKEIANHGKNARHCAIAELAGLLLGMADIHQKQVRFHTDNPEIGKRIFALVDRVFHFRPEVKVCKNHGHHLVYDIYINRQSHLVLHTCGYYTGLEGLVKATCCKRAFLRGAFLAMGSMSNPEKTYHLEFVLKHDPLAQTLMGLMQEFEIIGKKIRRKNKLVVYLKEGDQIVGLLNVLSAHTALMEVENLRIYKDMRNWINRQVNCESANLRKIGRAAYYQLEAINYIESTVGLDYLTEELKSVAILRKENMEVSLKGLSELSHPPVGRSGINHRLQKIIQIAEKIKDQGRKE